jgi:Fic family protein
MDAYPTRFQIIGKSGEKEWLRIEKERQQKAQDLSLFAKNDRPFWLVMVPEILSLVSDISQDKGFLSSLKLPDSYLRAKSKESKKREAYYSSRIEGASTTIEEAFRNMDKKTKNFADESMQMIYNNKLALEFMHRHKENDFTTEMVCELQKILVYNTHLTKPITVGEYRKGPIYVVDGQGIVVYEGPPADKAKTMMEKFVVWMNQKPPIHPLVDAGLVHLYFVHVHPFDDGNGRSARALSNLYLEKNGYDFINLLSPSDYFEHHKSAYYSSIQAAQAHGYDATYFVLYYLQALQSELSKIKFELEKEAKMKGIKEILDQNIRVKLNKRQIKAINFMVEKSEAISTQKYCKLNKCSDETARKDFILLQEMKLIETMGSGRSTKYIFKMAVPAAG